MSGSQEVRLLCRGALRSLLTGAEGKLVRAVYLWGSIVRPDFDPQCSDIDAVLISEGPALEETCRRLALAVTESQPALRHFKARPLYREDLDGAPPRSELARLIHPKILLADFASWWLVCGRRLTYKDFGLAPASLDEILALRLEALRRRLRTHQENPAAEPAQYILKEAAFICHALHQLRVGPHPFSYPALLTHAEKRTREVAEAVVALREGGWEDEACRRALGLAKSLLARIG
jgi:predicted nucleotidyltransferase